MGLVQAQGSFTFCSVPAETAAGTIKMKVPAFILAMTHSDQELLWEVARSLDLRNKVYAYSAKKGPGSAVLIVRDLGQLKNQILPLFHKNLRGAKKTQFEQWVSEMGTGLDVPERFRIIATLARKGGFYDRSAVKYV